MRRPAARRRDGSTARAAQLPAVVRHDPARAVHRVEDGSPSSTHPVTSRIRSPACPDRPLQSRSGEGRERETNEHPVERRREGTTPARRRPARRPSPPSTSSTSAEAARWPPAPEPDKNAGRPGATAGCPPDTGDAASPTSRTLADRRPANHGLAARRPLRPPRHRVARTGRLVPGDAPATSRPWRRQAVARGGTPGTDPPVLGWVCDRSRPAPSPSPDLSGTRPGRECRGAALCRRPTPGDRRPRRLGCRSPERWRRPVAEQCRPRAVRRARP